MNTSVRDPRAQFNALYREISDEIKTATQDIAGLDVDHQEGREAIAHIVTQLERMHRRFEGELALLEGNVEWDKFTIAFFGETNAGKSTIIESLRILFDEESRRELLMARGHDLARYQQSLEVHVERVKDALAAAHERNLCEFATVRQSVEQLKEANGVHAALRRRRLAVIAGLCGFAIGAAPALALALILHR